ncbi:MAG: HAMP domain-containing histidine kinase [Thermoplasmata archaeon]|nr:HAMP domain-containing histidine kinase [Thermoplasmata archaeon]
MQKKESDRTIPKPIDIESLPELDFDKLIENAGIIASSLLSIDNQQKLLDLVSNVIIKIFPIESMILFILDDRDVFVPIQVYGFPEAQTNKIKEKAFYTKEEVEEWEKNRAINVGRLSKFYPAENYMEGDEREILTTLRTDQIEIPRKNKDDWHPLDALLVRLLSRSGNEIGSFMISSTTTGKQLTDDALSGLEIFASFISVALELIRLREKEQKMLDSLENRANQISQILAVTSSLTSLSDPSKLAIRVLELTQELFGFKASSIALYDESEGCFRWRALKGYSEEQISRALTLRIPKDTIERDTNPDLKIGYLAHFRPVEKTLKEDLQYFYNFKNLEEAENAFEMPRESPNAWHPLDDLIFAIYDRDGRIIGIISPDDPADGKIPSRETLELLEVFVSLVAIAFENAHIFFEATQARDEVRVLNRLMFHDLMNYCMAIRGYLDLAIGQTTSGSIDKYLDRTRKQIDQISELIGKVRKLSMIRSADKQNLMRIDLAQTVLMQADKTSHLFPAKKVKFIFDMETKDAFVMANDLLPDLFHNIFMNAIKFDMHETVNVDISLQHITEKLGDSKIEHWQVSVADHGPGIPDERKQSIFLGSKNLEPSESARGMGLGLSIVKSLVSLYGGRVWAEDREPGNPRKGTVFHVRLPAA